MSIASKTIFSLFIIFLFFISPAFPARILLDVAEPPQKSHHPTQPSITFIMQDIHPKTKAIINQQQLQQPLLPFSKPLRTFPLTFGGTPSTYLTNPNQQNTPTQTFETPKFGIAFAATSKTLQQELEFGIVTNIEEYVHDGSSTSGPTTTVIGKARGVYVAMSSSENENNSHMMAMTVTFSIENGVDDDDGSSEVDSLKLFGVHKRDALECHVAVIGGTGKFKDANGFAAIKVVSKNKYIDDDEQSSEDQGTLMLAYNVYLS